MIHICSLIHPNSHMVQCKITDIRHPPHPVMFNPNFSKAFLTASNPYVPDHAGVLSPMMTELSTEERKKKNQILLDFVFL